MGITVGNSYDPKYLNDTDYAKSWYFKCKQDARMINRKITQEEYNELINTYRSYINAWDAEYQKEVDENNYRIDGDFDTDRLTDDEWNYYNNGKADAKSDFEAACDNKERKKGERKVNQEDSHDIGTADCVGSVVGTASGAVGGGIVEACGTGGIVMTCIGCALSAAVGIVYEATRPNKPETEALSLLNNIVLNDNDNSVTAQSKEITMGTKAADYVEDTFKERDDIEKELEEKQEIYDKAKAAYDEIMERYENGEELSEDDLAMLDEIGVSLGEMQEEIGKLRGNLAKTQKDSQKALDKQDAVYDEQKNNLIEAEGRASYEQEYGNQNDKNVELELGSQSMNIISSAVNMGVAIMYACFPCMEWMSAFAILAGAGLSMSIHGVAEQNDFKKTTENAIGTGNSTATQLQGEWNTYAESKALHDISSRNNAKVDVEKSFSDTEDWMGTEEVTELSGQVEEGINAIKNTEGQEGLKKQNASDSAGPVNAPLQNQDAPANGDFGMFGAQNPVGPMNAPQQNQGAQANGGFGMFGAQNPVGQMNTPQQNQGTQANDDLNIFNIQNKENNSEENIAKADVQDKAPETETKRKVPEENTAKAEPQEKVTDKNTNNQMAFGTLGIQNNTTANNQKTSDKNTNNQMAFGTFNVQSTAKQQDPLKNTQEKDIGNTTLFETLNNKNNDESKLYGDIGIGDDKDDLMSELDKDMDNVFSIFDEELVIENDDDMATNNKKKY